MYVFCLGCEKLTSGKMSASSSKVLVIDYINYRIEKSGHKWERCPALGEPLKAHFTMRTLGDEFEERYHDRFDDMCDQLHVTPDTAYPTFLAVINELFADGVKWGRVVALFSFGGALAVRSIEKNMPELVNNIVDWVTKYLDNNLSQWISQHGGWDGFVEFYENGPENIDESPWPSLKMCGYAAGAIGVITLGALLIQNT